MVNSNTSMEQMLRIFHSKYGHLINKHPVLKKEDIPKEVKDLRMRLIREEFEELMEGIEFHDMKEIADGAADLIYVVIGTCVSYGIPIERIFREVHRSNMTKTAVKAEGGQKYGTDNPKGPDYIAPDIEGILYRPERHTSLEIRAKVG